MRSNFTRQVVYAGLLLFGLCFLSLVTKLVAVVVIVTHFLPGFCLGFMFTQCMDNDISPKPKTLFIGASTCIHIACAFFINVARGDQIWTPLKLIFASSLGAPILMVIHDLLFKKKITVVSTFLLPLCSGFGASILSAYCIYCLYDVTLNQPSRETILWAGIFTIFPLWYYLFALNIKGKYAANATAVSS